MAVITSSGTASKTNASSAFTTATAPSLQGRT
jgi:hypothetical protein